MVNASLFDSVGRRTIQYAGIRRAFERRKQADGTCINTNLDVSRFCS